MKKIIVLLIVNAFFSCLFSQNIAKIKTDINHGGYGKLNDGKMAFVGFTTSIDSMGIYCHYLDGVNKDRLLIDKVYSPPIGWLNDNVILFFKKSNTGNFIYQLDINSKKTKKILSVDLVFEPELFIANDNDKIVYTYHYLRAKEQKTFIYDITSRKTTLIKGLNGRNIRRIRYHKGRDIIAFIELNQKEKHLCVFTSGKIEKLFTYENDSYTSESPMVFNDDGNFLFYVSLDDRKVTLFKYDFAYNVSSKICSWEQGVKCIDMSFSNDKLLLTMEGVGNKSIFLNKSSLKFEYKLEMESDLCMFIMEI
jgi:hypothetical protein